MRLDKWLWAARFFKTRKLAADAVKAGRVAVNGQRAKPGRVIHAGDALAIQRRPYVFEVSVDALTTRRGPPAEAARLYTETTASITAREQLARELKTRASQIIFDPGRPSRQDRRVALRRKRETP